MTTSGFSVRFCSEKELADLVLDVIANRGIKSLDVITVVIPSMKMGVSVQWKVRIWGPIKLAVWLKANCGLGPVTMAYDVLPAMQALQQGSPGKALDGIVFITRGPDGKPRPIAYGQVELGAALDIDIQVAEAAAGVYVQARLEVSIVDPYKNGRVSLPQLWHIVRTAGLGDGFTFQVTLEAGFVVWVKVCLVFCDTIYDKRFPLISIPLPATKGLDLNMFVSESGVIQSNIAKVATDDPVITVTLENGIQNVALSPTQVMATNSSPLLQRSLKNGLFSSISFASLKYSLTFVVAGLTVPANVPETNVDVHVDATAFGCSDTMQVSKNFLSCGGQPIQFENGMAKSLGVFNPLLTSQLHSEFTGLPCNVNVEVPLLGKLSLAGELKDFQNFDVAILNNFDVLEIGLSVSSVTISTNSVVLVDASSNTCSVAIHFVNTVSVLASEGVTNVLSFPLFTRVDVFGRGDASLVISSWDNVQGSVNFVGLPSRENVAFLAASGPGTLIDLGSSMTWTPSGGNVSHSLTTENLRRKHITLSNPASTTQLQISRGSVVWYQSAGNVVITKCEPGGIVFVNISSVSTITIGTVDGDLTPFIGCTIKVYGNDISDAQVTVRANGDNRSLVWSITEANGQTRIEINDSNFRSPSFFLFFEGMGRLSALLNTSEVYFLDGLEGTQVMLHAEGLGRSVVVVCDQASAIGALGKVDVKQGPVYCSLRDTSNPLSSLRALLAVGGDGQSTVHIESEACSESVSATMFGNCLSNTAISSFGEAGWVISEMLKAGVNVGNCSQMFLNNVELLSFATGVKSDEIVARNWTIPTVLSTGAGADAVTWDKCTAFANVSIGSGKDTLLLGLPLTQETNVILFPDGMFDFIHVYLPTDFSTSLGRLIKPSSSGGGFVTIGPTIEEWDRIYVHSVKVPKTFLAVTNVTINITISDPGTLMIVEMASSTKYNILGMASLSSLNLNGVPSDSSPPPTAPVVCVNNFSSVGASIAVLCNLTSQCTLIVVEPTLNFEFGLLLSGFSQSNRMRNDLERSLNAFAGLLAFRAKLSAGSDSLIHVDLLNVPNIEVAASQHAWLRESGPVDSGISAIVRNSRSVTIDPDFIAPVLLDSVGTFARPMQQVGLVVLVNVDSTVLSANTSITLQDHIASLPNDGPFVGSPANGWWIEEANALIGSSNFSGAIEFYRCQNVTFNTSLAVVSGLSTDTVFIALFVKSATAFGDYERVSVSAVLSGRVLIVGNEFRLVALSSNAQEIVSVKMNLDNFTVSCGAGMDFSPDTSLRQYDAACIPNECRQNINLTSGESHWMFCDPVNKPRLQEQTMGFVTGIAVIFGVSFLWKLVGMIIIAWKIRTHFVHSVMINGSIVHLGLAGLAARALVDICPRHVVQDILLSARYVVFLYSPFHSCDVPLPSVIVISVALGLSFLGCGVLLILRYGEHEDLWKWWNGCFLVCVVVLTWSLPWLLFNAVHMSASDNNPVKWLFSAVFFIVLLACFVVGLICLYRQRADHGCDVLCLVLCFGFYTATLFLFSFDFGATSVWAMVVCQVLFDVGRVAHICWHVWDLDSSPAQKFSPAKKCMFVIGLVLYLLLMAFFGSMFLAFPLNYSGVLGFFFSWALLPVLIDIVLVGVLFKHPASAYQKFTGNLVDEAPVSYQAVEQPTKFASTSRPFDESPVSYQAAEQRTKSASTRSRPSAHPVQPMDRRVPPKKAPNSEEGDNSD